MFSALRFPSYNISMLCSLPAVSEIARNESTPVGVLNGNGWIFEDGCIFFFIESTPCFLVVGHFEILKI